MQSELDQIWAYEVSSILEPEEPLPKGYRHILYNLVFDVKFDGSTLSWFTAKNNSRSKRHN